MPRGARICIVLYLSRIKLLKMTINRSMMIFWLVFLSFTALRVISSLLKKTCLPKVSSYRGGQRSDEARKQSSRDITKRGGGAEEEEKGREGWRREQESRRKSREKEMRRWRKWEMWLRIALVETTKNARNISYHQLLFSAQETIFNVFSLYSCSNL